MTSGLTPASEAVYGQLQDLAIAGGIQQDVPQAPTYPFVWVELQARNGRGLGNGGLQELELRTHTFSALPGKTEAQAIDDLVVGRLKDAALTLPVGFRQCGLVFYDDTIPLSDQELNGVKVHEVVSLFRLFVEEG